MWIAALDRQGTFRHRSDLVIPVISNSGWLDWCDRHGLNVDSAEFALETCYYGTHWRSRPGTLLVTKSAIIHYSYNWYDTLWAIFEPSVRIEISTKEVVEARHVAPSLTLRFLAAFPESVFEVDLDDGSTHELILQRRGAEFHNALKKHGVRVVDQTA